MRFNHQRKLIFKSVVCHAFGPQRVENQLHDPHSSLWHAACDIQEKQMSAEISSNESISVAAPGRLLFL
jgi:hypothetical protein